MKKSRVMAAVVSITSLVLAFGGNAHAYQRGVAPSITNIEFVGPGNFTSGDVVVYWDKALGKPATYTFKTYTWNDGQISINNKVPGSAGSKGWLALTNSPRCGGMAEPVEGVTWVGYKITLTNAWGSHTRWFKCTDFVTGTFETVGPS